MWSEFAKRTALKATKAKPEGAEMKRKSKNEKKSLKTKRKKISQGKKQKKRKKKGRASHPQRLRLAEFKQAALAEFEKMVKMHFQKWEELERNGCIPNISELVVLPEIKPNQLGKQSSAIGKLAIDLKSRSANELKSMLGEHN